MSKKKLEKQLSELVSEFHSQKGNRERRLLLAKRFLRLKNTHIHLFQDNVSQGVPDHEVWLNCQKWETLYQISNFGRIRAHETFFIKWIKNKQMAVYKPKKIRSTRVSPASQFGYPIISFWRNEKASHLTIHRLVGLHFVPNPHPRKYKQVLHLDNNAGNPHFKNLKWGTQKHNIQQAVADGRWHIGPKNNKTKLNEEQVRIIRVLISEGIRITEIARQFNVQHPAIGNIKNGRTWKHIK